MRLQNLIAVLIFFSIINFQSCSTVPVTGRSQLNVIPSSELMSMSFQQYDQFLKENKLSTNRKQSAMIKRVGDKISKAVEQYFAQNNMSDELKGYQWEFNLVENDQVNAWAMPGGKVVFYTGILPITKTEAGVAVVMGHEVAHAVAEHGGERMSHQVVQQFGGMALSKLLEEESDALQGILLTAYGVGSQVGVMLPFSRLHESEADHLGLIFMAMAGYNPQEAVNFWQRMADAKGGEAPPEWLSTHPSDQTRIDDLKKAIPEAMKYYKK
ncbi:MAG: M48 family metallopeptidase [Ignavibacteriae bacterium]|nr:M48 family peptidase [Ignavibacteriota bacterium]NOG98378.1 M48 family metallopeptidase [Ignavibacteriota bacterium]